MTKEEAHDFIARHYVTYINKPVYFESAGITAIVKAIDAVESDGGNFVPTCFLESPEERDPDFEGHLFSHLPLQEVMDTGRILPS
jgi:hypothetical protein